MIRLTRLNNQAFALNSDLIKWVECSPDTVVTLITGEKLIVREGIEEIISRIVDFRHSVFSTLPLSGTDPLSVTATLSRQPESRREQAREGRSNG